MAQVLLRSTLVERLHLMYMLIQTTLNVLITRRGHYLLFLRSFNLELRFMCLGF